MRLRFPFLALVIGLFAACGGKGDETAGNGTDAGLGDAATDTDPFTLGDSGTCAPPCMSGFMCFNGACVQEQTCASDNECQNDTYCDKTLGKCVPYGPPGKTHNADCATVVPVGENAALIARR